MPSAETQSGPAARYRTESRDGAFRVVFEGDWTTAEIEGVDRDLRGLDLKAASSVELDASGVHRLDSAGAWLLVRTARQVEENGGKVAAFAVPKAFGPLVELLEKGHTAPPVVLPVRHTLDYFLERVGRGTFNVIDTSLAMLSYLGEVIAETWQTAFTRQKLRWTSFVNQIDETGIAALPIVGLLSFLVGVVIAYQGADQLRRFGAEIFTINLVGVSMLRELGVLMTSIIIAGRSGSAFTAHIGTMKVNQEVDAMETIGLNVVEVLVLPRVIGLMLVLPILTLYSDVMGIVGGAVMCYFSLDIGVPDFFRQLQSAVKLSTFLVGLVKAPIFAFIISWVGCFEGLRVEGNAASVGRQTTRSVVESIFLIIVFDAAFSVLFSILGV